MKMRTKHKTDQMTMSYKRLQFWIGVMGVGLPIVCVLGGIIRGGVRFETTLSGYYYTNMQDVFVGILVCTSLFLMTYKGYEKLDQYITTFSGVAGLGVALFPTNNALDGSVRAGVLQLVSTTSNWFHLVFAFWFFVSLGAVSYFIFTMTDDIKKATSMKLLRNHIYRGCGVAIGVLIVLLIITANTLPESFITGTPYLLVLETLMLWAFGFSWMVKGGWLFKDRA